MRLKTNFGFLGLVYMVHFHFCTAANVSTQATAVATTGSPVLDITSVLAEPFLIDDGGEYKGVIPDLIKLLKLEEIAGYPYKLRLAKDGKYGSKTGNTTWNGMIGELVRQEADMAAAPLTITYAREAVVNFSKPFMSTGITMIVKRPKDTVIQPNAFLILRPFTAGVWILIIIIFVVVSILFYLLNRFHPYEWRAVHSRGKGMACDASTFNVLGSFWFSITTLTLQGYKKAPRSLAGRTVAALWFFFVLLTLIMYIASLVNFLSVSWPIVLPAKSLPKSLDEMAKMDDFQFGMFKEGSTKNFFSASQIPLYKSIYQKAVNKDSFITEISEGTDRVLQGDGNFGLFIESHQAEYLTSENCDLVQFGALLNSNGLAFAFPAGVGSTIISKVNYALLKLQETGDMQMLYNKWFRKDTKCPALGDVKPLAGSPRIPQPVNSYKYSGVIALLIIGMIVAVILGVVEFIYFRMKGKGKDLKAKSEDKESDAEKGLLADAEPPADETVVIEENEDEVKAKPESDTDEKAEKEDAKEKSEPKGQQEEPNKESTDEKPVELKPETDEKGDMDKKEDEGAKTTDEKDHLEDKDTPKSEEKPQEVAPVADVAQTPETVAPKETPPADSSQSPESSAPAEAEPPKETTEPTASSKPAGSDAAQQQEQ